MKKITLLFALALSGLASMSHAQSNLSELLDRYEELKNSPLSENMVLRQNFTESEISVLNNYFAEVNQDTDLANNNGSVRVPDAFTVLDVRNDDIFGTLPANPPYTSITEIANPLGATSFCDDYADDGKLYAFNIQRDEFGTFIGLDFITVNDETGAIEVVADVFNQYTSFPGGLAFDFTTSTMYSLAGGLLFTVDLETGAATPIGAVNTGPGGVPIWLVIDNEGNGYIADIVDDSFYSIDLTDATTTLIGPLGIDIAFAQDATVDPADNTLYMAAYTGGGTGGVYTVDVATGTATLFGDTFPLNAEFGMFSVPGEPSLGVESNVLSQISVYPNPSSDFVNVKVPSSIEIISITVYDLLGKKTEVQASNNNILDITSLAKGTYLLNIETTAGKLTDKIIKN